MTPKTYLVGYTQCHIPNITAYLHATQQADFINDINQSYFDGVSEQLGLCSMFAKLCYKSLVLGKNKNVTKIRPIKDNIKAIIDSGHGSVLEHLVFNFITTNCSRVYTHELVRHRVGTAFSQTSGRYCAIDEDSEIVLDDPILAKYNFQQELQQIFNKLKEDIGNLNKQIPDGIPFSEKKKITSALRRIAPNGQSNEIAWSANLRSLRHMIEMRTSPHAEWEIQHVFKDVAEMLYNFDPLLLYGGTKKEDGSWVGLRV